MKNKAVLIIISLIIGITVAVLSTEFIRNMGKDRDKSILTSYEIGYVQGCRDYQELKGFSAQALDFRLNRYAKQLGIDTTLVLRANRLSK